MTKEAKKKEFIYTVGRRKRSVARIRLYLTKGQSLVNDKPLEEYFRSIPEVYYLKPFELTKTTGKYYVTAKIEGGGLKGQAGAFVHGLSRALVKADSKNKAFLKTAGLLTRDPREKERRKFGLAQKARARKQSPKR
ncbi:MAG: 30S ribosomal protein S9 [Microgenomates group bacterium]